MPIVITIRWCTPIQADIYLSLIHIFRFEENKSGDYNDGTYRIVPKASTGRCFDIWDAEDAALELWGNACYASRGFAFEPVDGSGLTLKAKAEYTESCQYVGIAEDNDGNKTYYEYDENKDELKKVTDVNGNVMRTGTTYAGGLTTVFQYYDKNNDGSSDGDPQVQTVYKNGMLNNIKTGTENYHFAYDGFGNQTSCLLYTSRCV